MSGRNSKWNAQWNRKFSEFPNCRENDNLQRLTKNLETNFSKNSVPFDSVPGFPEIMVQWVAPPVNLEIFRLFIPARLDRTVPFSFGRKFPELYDREVLEIEIFSNGTVISEFSGCSDFSER